MGWGAICRVSRARDPWEPARMRPPYPARKDILVYRRELRHDASLRSQTAGLGPLYLRAETERMVTVSLPSLVRNSTKSSPWEPGQVNATQPAELPRCSVLQGHRAPNSSSRRMLPASLPSCFTAQDENRVLAGDTEPRAKDKFSLMPRMRGFGSFQKKFWEAVVSLSSGV